MTLARKAAAELLGTALLVAAVVGSGVMATRLSEDPGLQLLQNSIATGAVLVALILTLQPVSAAFNPAVTVLEVLLRMLAVKDAAVLIAAQVVGGCGGAVLANLMFELDAVTLSQTSRSGGHLWLAEVVATVGLLIVVFGAIRSGRTETIAYAVGGYIAAAYWFTSSTGFANPAVTVARTLSDTFAGIRPSSAPMFVLMQLVAVAIAFFLVRFLYPTLTTSRAASDLRQGARP